MSTISEVGSLIILLLDRKEQRKREYKKDVVVPLFESAKKVVDQYRLLLEEARTAVHMNNLQSSLKSLHKMEKARAAYLAERIQLTTICDELLQSCTNQEIRTLANACYRLFFTRHILSSSRASSGRAFLSDYSQFIEGAIKSDTMDSLISAYINDLEEN